MDSTQGLFSRVDTQLAAKGTKIVITIILITLLCNTLFSQALFYESLNSIIEYQSSSTHGTKTFFNLVSFLANPVFVVFVMSLLLPLWKNRIRVLVFISFFIINVYLMTVIKAMYHEARPFWYSTIQQLEWTCPREYGNPSGHSWLVVVLYEPLLHDFFPASSRVGKVLRWIFLATLLALVPFSRMYLGAHSGNQVFFGLLMGISMITLYRLTIQKQLYTAFEWLMRISEKTNAGKKTLLILLIHSIVTLIPVLIYMSAPTQDFQYIRVLNQKCPDSIATSIGLNGGVLFFSMLISFLFGLVYGLVNTTPSALLYICGQWKYHGRMAEINLTILKVSGELSLILSPGIIIIFMSYWIEGVIIGYYLYSCVITLAGYILTRYSHSLLLYLSIIKIHDPIGDLL